MAVRMRNTPARDAAAGRRALADVHRAGETPDSGDAAGSAALEGAGFSVVRTKGPYEALATKGSFDGLITLPTGEEVHVRIRPGKNPSNWPPIVYLDGLNGAASRSKKIDTLTETHGHTLVSVALLGQGETLLRDLEKTGGQSLADDIDPKDQVSVLMATLDTLGVKAPVHLLGLSYGGGIAALAKQTHPDRFQKLMLVAPYTKSMSLHDPMRAAFHAALTNPWNPMGQFVYRSITETALSFGVFPPDVFTTTEQREACRKGFARLTLGMETFDLETVAEGLEHVHFLSMPLDVVSPGGMAKAAYAKTKKGSFTDANFFFDGWKHDLIDLDPTLMTRWVQSVMRDQRKGLGHMGLGAKDLDED
ncbi:MAG: alpha/beta hydrolase [Deltaproteobacteria bacterium]|nr:alpha/beta hydrolase [Deltaproteobacteria bacterium]